jgi:hypothetical protein
LLALKHPLTKELVVVAVRKEEGRTGAAGEKKASAVLFGAPSKHNASNNNAGTSSTRGLEW